MYDFTEILKLARGLMSRNIPFELDEIYDGWGIWVGEEWDAVIHRKSMGHEENLLEVFGRIARSSFDDDVEGYLTADEILARL